MRPITAEVLTEPQRRALGVALGKLLGSLDPELVHRAEPPVPKQRPAKRRRPSWW